MKKTILSQSIAVLACLGLATTLAYAVKPARKSFGKGAPFAVEELPEGNLKTHLQSLAPQAKEKAMTWLHTFNFDTMDAAGHLRVDNDGGIFMVCPDNHGDDAGLPQVPHTHSATSHSPGVTGITGVTGTGATDPAPTSATEPPVAGVAVPISSPPAYHSKPGATRFIYLDFNGGVVSGKQWNASAGVTSWNCYAWSTDTDYSTFTDSEQAEIRRTWERISEDYAPFDIDVTTDAAYDVDNYTGDKNKVGWLMFTPTTDKNGTACPHNGYGGVAYVGVFGNSNYFSAYQPAWVAPYTAANATEAGSHEMGHNMGLSHDGTSALGYYGGHAATASAPSWGPIMGTGYGQNMTQWSKGEYYDANEFQDDLAIIAARVPYRADDCGDTFATATAAVATNNAISKTGIVENSNDPDVFSFVTGVGAISFTANPFRSDTSTWGGNLDILLELYDSSQTLIASNNPATTANASISTTINAAGTYYLVIKPSAAGTPLVSPPSGYAMYGSLGQYAINGTVQPFDPPLGLTGITPSSGNAGSTVTVDISGTKLAATTAVRLKQAGRADIVGTSVQMIGNTLRCQFNLTGAAAGLWNLHAANPDLQTATLTDAFTVIAVPITLWSENFDGTVTGWASQAVSGTSNSWSVVSTQSYSPTKSYFAAGPSTASVAHLISPSISIPSGATDLQIEFWHRYDLQSTRDGGRFSLSIDGGTWFDVTDSGSGASFTLNGYNTAMASNGQTGLFAGLQAWSGINNTFSKTVISLSDLVKYSGKSLRMRWEIATNSQTASTGWYVDSVSLIGSSGETPPNQAPVITVAASTSSTETQIEGPTTYQIIRGAGSNLSVTATDDAGESYLTYTWSRTSGPAPVVFSANGSNAAKSTAVTFSQTGDYLLTVSALDTGNLSTTSSVNVRVLATGTYVVSPSTASVQVGASQQFDVILSDQFGVPFASQPSPVNWSTSGGGGINSSGLFSATSAGGPYTITATGGAYTGTASVSVTPIPASINLSNLNQTYDGFLKPVTVTTTPSGLAHSVTYNGLSTVPTNGGTYAVVATITGPNYTGSASGSLVISYTVTYQGNGNTSGTVPAAQTKFHDVNLTLATNSGSLNKTDFSFSEWNTAADGSGTAYPAGGTYSGNASLTLYAQWVPGANGTWIQTTAGPYDWGTSANWSGGTVAAGADRTASFTPNFTVNQTVNLESARTIGNITFTDSTTASNDLTISGANTLTLSRTSGTPTINVTNRTLTISSQISGNSGLRKDGAGQLTLSGTSNFTGGTVLNAGILATSADANLGTGGGITVTGTSTWNAGAASAVTYNRGLTVNDGTILTLASGNALKTVTGVLSGNGAITNSATTSFEFNNTGNTFTGAVSNGYEMRFNSLGDSSNAINLIGSNGLFTWQGAAKTFVLRPFTLNAVGTGIINNNGTGALTIQQNLAFSGVAGVRTLTLQGTNTGTNTFSGNIANNGASTTALTKSGAGTWALGGTNSYSGDTNLAASGTTGILIFQGSQALSASTTLKFAQNSSSVQSVRFLDNGTGTINFNRPIEFGGNNTSQILNIAVGNNNTNNGGSGSGTTTGSTIQVGNITFTSTAADTNTTTLNATNSSSNGYRLQTGTITLNNLVTRTAGQTTVTVLNPTTANMTVAAITMATGNTGIANDGVPVLRLDGTATDNIVTGNVTNASDYLTGQALGLQKQGPGNWALNGTGNNFTGTITFTGTTASGGKLSFASASGTNPITFNATTGFGSTLTYTGASPLTMSGLVTASALTSGGILFEANGTVPTATINYSNASSLSTSGGGAAVRFVTFGGSNTGDNTFAGAINNGAVAGGNTQVAKVDAGKWVFTGSGNYSGGIFISAGTVSVNSIPDSSSNSPLGANTRINLGTDNTTGTLIYTGGGNTSNRDLRLGGPSTNSGSGGSSILNDGTGALTFTAATFNAAQTGILFNRTLTLGGSYTGAANEIQGIIQNNTATTGLVHLEKTGASTWKLSGANTYSGNTTISAGTLELGSNNVLPDTSAVSVADAILNAATFADTAGTLDVTGTATINLGAGAALAFADSSAIDWTGGSLNITGTFVSGSSLRFGTSSTGLSSAQLALVSRPDGGPVVLDSNGYLVSVPVITFTGAPIVAVNTTYGIPSPAPTRFSVSAGSLAPATGSLAVAALSGFEYSTSVGGTYTTTLLIPYTGGALSSTDVFVRLAAYMDVAGSPYSGNISVSGGGATPQTIATVSSTVGRANPAVIITVGSYTYNGSAQGPTAYTTSPSGDTGAPTWSYEGTGGTTYGPSATRPTDAGSYTATVALAADSNFDAASSSASAFTIANGNPYPAWAGAAAFDADTNNDGVDNGIAWLLGAANKDVNVTGLLPTFDNTTDPEYFIFTYRRSDAANTAPNTIIKVQYSSNLKDWTDAAAGPDVIITQTDNFYATSPDVDKVQVKIRRTLAVDGKLVARLSILNTP